MGRRTDSHTSVPVGKMGRKNASGPPAEQHRKQIGRQESKKAKQEFKKSKRREGAVVKKAKAAGYGAIILLAILLILVVVYLFLYLYLQNKSEQVKLFVVYVDNLLEVYVKPYLPW